MPRLPGSVPTEVELSILNVLWERGPSTVREIHCAMSRQKETGYSTTLKMVQVMTEKGLVLKDESRRPQVYRPARAKEKTQLQLLDDLIQRGFGGSAAKLVLRAVAAKRVSGAELLEIRKLIAQAKERD
ncbi:MAG: BlaI/MecI/CopY family transcriptional regulator [Phycisphaerales bacterium]|nr:BlaI/MecI/CopY family transcriptional regulator [Phycisphaerales bacterium]